VPRVLVVLVAAGMAVWALLDLAQTPRGRVRLLPKPGWVALVLLLPFVGGLAWLLLGRAGPDEGRRPVDRSVPPDDDPEFLRRLGERRPEDPENRP